MTKASKLFQEIYNLNSVLDFITEDSDKYLILTSNLDGSISVTSTEDGSTLFTSEPLYDPRDIKKTMLESNND